MAGNTLTGIGIEYDNQTLHAAKIAVRKDKKKTLYSIERLEESSGNFSKDDELVNALKKVKQQMHLAASDLITTCVFGKQVYAAQIPFRLLAPQEMGKALTFEIRKNCPFDVSGLEVEYQVVKQPDAENGPAQIVVSAVSKLFLDKHLRVLENAGIKPHTVDSMPCAVANIYWSAAALGQKQEHLLPVILHIGPEVSTVIIDGANAPFYHRTIYFIADVPSKKQLPQVSAAEKNSDAESKVSAPDMESKTNGFIDELARSMQFYESNYHRSQFSTIFCTGSCCTPQLLSRVKEKTGLHVERIGLSQQLGPKQIDDSSAFDLAVALALRAENFTSETREKNSEGRKRRQ
ncbi:MAG: pilus assembly protein PilM [Chitinivibrionales bacterium]|nr:pilus assembly protein PilM [Chitinivibrionales bacterium]